MSDAPYRYEVLTMWRDLDDLVSDAGEALAEHGRWTAFVEVRMGAGPTVELVRSPATGGDVIVTVAWGSQRGEAKLGSIAAALEAADRIARTFSTMRSEQAVR